MRITIKDIARDCNVGVATVSRCINDSGSVKPEVKERILKRVEELNWSPAASATTLKTGKSNIAAIIIPDFSHYITHWMLQCLNKSLTAMGYQILVQPDRDNRGIGKLLKNQIDVAIILNYYSTEDKDKKIRQLLDQGVHVIGVFGHKSFFPVVYSNHHQSASDATEILIKAGHEKIGLIANDYSLNVKNCPENMVFQGVQQSMATHHLSFTKDNNLIPVNDDCISLALNQKSFTAYIVFTVDAQLKFYIHCREQGIAIPDQISMIGLEGDAFFPALNPPPTHFIHDYQTFTQHVESFIKLKGAKPDGRQVPFIYVPGQSIKKVGDVGNE